MNRFEVKKSFKIWNNNDGVHWEVCEDKNHLGFIEIIEYNRENKISQKFLLEQDCALKLANSIIEFCKNN